MATRIDSWIWAIRLTKTRSAAGAACKGGHVRLNGNTVKPSATVAVGDQVTVRTGGRERIVEVTGLINKRVSAPVAAENYIDHSPPPPPREVLASLPRRDRGAGRPTKRERRQLEKFRTGTFLTVLAAVGMLVLTGCGDSGPSGTEGEAPTPQAGTGPDFERCGGLDAGEVARLTRIEGLQPAVENPSACEWQGPASEFSSVSFNWYRGSPIGRERGTEQLSRDLTQDYSVDGVPGFIAYTGAICEIGLSWDADFIEISVHAGLGPDRAPTMPTDAVCAGAKRLAETVVKEAG
ncbi:DUF3558 family protein [Gordonia zhaorongruii]|uniref:DUF3558 family protein n=1 Tax=Gordonia zhaorongruii TaxID=2597659 RepID=UPI00104ACC0E|nr:DUF3558 family protein [Gordonia zhaorongruii]